MWKFVTQVIHINKQCKTLWSFLKSIQYNSLINPEKINHMAFFIEFNIWKSCLNMVSNLHIKYFIIEKYFIVIKKGFANKYIYEDLI